MQDVGIVSFGAYVPKMRLERSAIADAHEWMAPALRGMAKGRRAFMNWDEDTITMAVEAGLFALTDVDNTGIETIGFASTRAPFADLQNGSIVAGALGLKTSVAAVDIAGSQRCGMSGLMQALKTGEQSLFIASDAPLAKPASTQEMQYGAGAAGFVVGGDNLIAKYLGGASVTVNFVDHYRTSGEKYDYFWEGRWVRDEGYLKIAPQAIELALQKANLTIDDIDHFAMPSLLARGASATAKKIGFKGEVYDSLGDDCGYAGSAHAPLLLASLLGTAKPGEKIMVVGFGQGADVLIFEVTGDAEKRHHIGTVSKSLSRGIRTDHYMRFLSFCGLVDVDWGMRAEKNAKTALTEQYRSMDQISRFKAGKCSECDTIQFPQLEYCVQPNCAASADHFTPVSLVNVPAKVLTFTADWLTYHPSPPLYVGFVQFENGARVMMEVVDVDSEIMEIGLPVRMVYRIKEHDKARNYNRYFWKAAPVLAQG